MKATIIILLSILITSCALNKQERQDRRANRKLEKLTNKYPQLITKDTLIDTVKVLIPEIKIDTVIQTNQDVTEVDSILLSFEDKLDSLTRIQLGDEIKYYITKRQVIEDTLFYEEDGVTVKVYQEGDVIRVQVNKPESEVTEVVTNVVDTIKPVEIPWYKTLLSEVNRYAIPIAILVLLFWVIIRVIRFYTGKSKN